MRNKFYSLLAVAGVVSFMAMPMAAHAADLGGDCCADLEERVADLEKTTARKGNRKVSLTISGHVNQAIMFWDDGVDSDTYVVGNSHSQTRFRFKGSAKINSDWSAGYYIEVGINDALSGSVNATNDDADSMGIRQSHMYIKSQSLGTFSWGQASPGTDDLAHYGSVAGLAGHMQGDFHYNRGFKVVDPDGVRSPNLTIGNFASSQNGTIFFDGTTRQSIIRYDTPTIAGFKLTAAWGENDFWDVALRTKQTLGDFIFKGAVGYMKFDEVDHRGATEEKSLVASAGLMHNPTGLFVHGAYRDFKYDGDDTPEAKGWFVQGGIKNKWNALGNTALWIQYTKVEDGYFRAQDADDGSDNWYIENGTSTELTRWNVGLTQWVDAANMELYAIYEQTTAEIEDIEGEDFKSVILGGRIQF